MADEKVKDGFFASSVHRLRANPWIITTFFLVIALFVVLVLRIPASSNGGLSGNVVSQEVATSNLLTFIKAQAGEDAKLVSVAKDNNFYDITVNFQGQDVPVLVTLDGQFLVAQAIPLNATKPSANATQQQAAPANVTKSDKPKVQAFIFSYCPYGLQFEKALIPAYDLLKTTADIDIVAIGAMHGEFEHVESLRQLCIEKNYGRDKLFSYLKAFDENSDIGSCSGTDSCVNPLIEKIYTTLGIDKAKIATCMEKDAPALYDAQGNLSQSLGVSGSPTFVINGAQVQVSRTPEAIKTAICDAYTTAPSVCNQTLSSSAMTPGFGASAGTSTGSSCG